MNNSPNYYLVPALFVKFENLIPVLGAEGFRWGHVGGF